jgi:hypothetical protein
LLLQTLGVPDDLQLRRDETINFSREAHAAEKCRREAVDEPGVAIGLMEDSPDLTLPGAILFWFNHSHSSGFM